MARKWRIVVPALTAAALVGSACSTTSTRAQPIPLPGGGAVAIDLPAARPAAIEQPLVTDLQVAAESRRVDLAMPTFSDPANVTNPLFPISSQESVLMLGHVDGQPFRTEVTLLPDTRHIEWGGQAVETLVSQYVAYLGGRLHEVAYDFYAQDDDGNVWYFGEDVFNFKDGAISDTHGTWIAGKDGPAAMIMPAEPQIGDVYRPENIPGFVFEEVTVKAVDQTIEGPLGTIEGALVVEELHMDGTTEEKTFAPGYGEFFTGGSGDVEAVALAVPVDRLSEPVPTELTTLQARALAVFDATGKAGRVSASVDAMRAAWDAYSTATDVPAVIEARMTRALDRLAQAIRQRDAEPARQAAIDVAQGSLDLQLRYRPAIEIDLARFDLWLAQIQIDAEAHDAALMSSSFFSLDYIRDRIQHVLDPAADINLLLEELLSAVGDADFAAAADLAGQLRGTIAGAA